MQNRYVGDIGDFGKYGLLRALCLPGGGEGPALRLGIVWYLTSDETHNNDGRHIGYLEPTPRNILEFQGCDPELYDVLRKIVGTGNRTVSAIRQRGVLPESTIYDERILDLKGYAVRPVSNSRMKARMEWVKEAIHATRDCEIVFVDPDNGIGSITQASSRLGSKYVLLEELDSYFVEGQTVVIYHHLNRRATAEIQIKERLTQLRQHFGASAQVMALRYRRGSSRVFFLLTKDIRIAAVLDEKLARFLGTPWCNHFIRLA